MPGLLVSVRSRREAAAALGGGATIVDVKEPAAGALGRASGQTIADVLGVAGSRVPVSAALGELGEGSVDGLASGLAYVKWGLAGCSGTADWRRRLAAAAHDLAKRHPSTGPVAVAYADWQRASAPRPQEVCEFACRHAWPALLVDTWQKDGTTLLDWLSLDFLQVMRDQCNRRGVRIALAGSLGLDQIRQLRVIRPDWFAVRGAACRGGERGGEIDSGRVRALVECAGVLTASTSSS